MHPTRLQLISGQIKNRNQITLPTFTMVKLFLWILFSSVFHSVVVTSFGPIHVSSDDVKDHMSHGHTRDYLLLDMSTPSGEQWDQLVLKSSTDELNFVQVRFHDK